MAANPQFNQSSLYAALWFAGGGVCVFATSTLMSVAFSETPLAKQAWWFWLLMAAPLILCLILFVFAKQYKRQQTAFMQAANKPEDTLSEAKLLALSSAIRPHFFFNALNTVLSLIRTQPKQAEAVLMDVAELLRTVMFQDSQKLMTLGEEIGLTERYLNIVAVRMGARLHTDWRVDKTLYGAQIPPFVLQPLVENAVLHGVEQRSEPSIVRICVKRFDNQLHLTVSNQRAEKLETATNKATNQTTNNENNTTPHNGMALGNIRNRLSLLYAESARFRTRQFRHAFVAKIVLPIEFEGA